MAKTTLWLVAAACFLLATVAGAIGMAVSDGSWTLVVIPLALKLRPAEWCTDPGERVALR